MDDRDERSDSEGGNPAGGPHGAYYACTQRFGCRETILDRKIPLNTPFANKQNHFRTRIHNRRAKHMRNEVAQQQPFEPRRTVTTIPTLRRRQKMANPIERSIELVMHELGAKHQ